MPTNPSTITSRLNQLRSELSAHDVTLLCVTKYASVDQTRELIRNQQYLLGESRIQNALKKAAEIQHPSLIWHMIGHLQSNKVRQAVALFDCIQSVDSLKILAKINSEAKRIHKHQSCMLQVNLANDPKKHGFSKPDLLASLAEISAFPNCDITGIMTIGPQDLSENELRSFFQETRALYNHIRTIIPSIKTLSMGMSQDYKIAIQEGSTMVRVGSRVLN